MKHIEPRAKDTQQGMPKHAGKTQCSVSQDEATALNRLVRDYAYALDLIDAYDHGLVDVSGVSAEPAREIEYAEALGLIDTLREHYQAGDLFGQQKNDSFQASLANVFETVDGKELHPSIEENGANLLYFLVRDRPFVDGNKRIAASMFLWFLERNGALYRPDGTKRIADNALVALILMVAESGQHEKDLIVKITVNLVNRRN